MLWDIFCRVVDNFGDLGVCWRLAGDLATRGEAVRLWVDDASALAWMAPQGAPGVELLEWTADTPALDPGEVVIEAFGCNPPAAFVERMARNGKPPVWINLEYLSAEDYVERSHGLPSPQASGPGAGLTKWFFYPGFTPRTGGLLREPAVMAHRLAFHREAWLAAHGLSLRAGERVVSLFCYANPAIASLLDDLAKEPTLLLATPGAAQSAVGGDRGGLRVHALPWLNQSDYDRLLWACDLNFVRGEDSFVRAQWAGAPFVWQIYPQHDAVHAAKLDAFLQRFGGGEPLRALWHAWNELGPWPEAWPEREAWEQDCRKWRDSLLAQTDLTTQLLSFVQAKKVE
jgi:uncharacterized repeat protein (TIGR03837 family)